jgi:hypothetical protein
MKDESIFEIKFSPEIIEHMEEMKTIMIKGIGYFTVSKTHKITKDTFLDLAISMEKRNIEI